MEVPFITARLWTTQADTADVLTGDRGQIPQDVVCMLLVPDADGDAAQRQHSHLVQRAMRPGSTEQTDWVIFQAL
jgi:hypothetical protein